MMHVRVFRSVPGSWDVLAMNSVNKIGKGEMSDFRWGDSPPSFLSGDRPLSPLSHKELTFAPPLPYPVRRMVHYR